MTFIHAVLIAVAYNIRSILTANKNNIHSKNKKHGK